MPKSSSSTNTKKTRKIHPGEALGIIPSPTPHKNRNTRRYKKGDLDVDSIIAFLTQLRESNDMPTPILRIRGRLRNAFPGFGIAKPAIKAAYNKAGWPLDEIDWTTKKEMKAAKEREKAARET